MRRKAVVGNMRSPKTVAFVLTAIYLISLIPILGVAFYTHPVLDDYGYSRRVHEAVLQGGNIFNILAAVGQTVKETYFNWQGTYFAVAIFSLQPGVISQKFYFLTTFLMIGALSIGTFFFLETVITRWLGCRKSYSVIVPTFILLMSIQFVPDKSEAFYWFNGSSYYTLFYSFALVFNALLIRIYLGKGWKRTVSFVCSLLLAVLIGGGNYPTALYMAMILCVVTALLAVKKDQNVKVYLLITMVLIVSLAVSMMAPGNTVRAASSEGMDPVSAITASLFHGAVLFGMWSALPQVTFCIFIFPVMLKAAHRCNWTFRWPLVVLCLAAGIFAGQLAPPFYAQSNIDAGRLTNLFYYSYYMLLLFMEFYLCGWMLKKYPKMIRLDLFIEMIRRNMVVGPLMLVLIWCLGCLQYRIHDMTSVQTALAFLSGEVQQYDYEFEQNILKLTSGEEDVVLTRMEHVPEFFKDIGIAEDPEYWVNRQMGDYFHINSIVLEEQ